MSNRFSKPILEKLRFEVNLAEHCNLNCVCCDHFSPVAEKKFLDSEQYERDLIRLAELFPDKVANVLLVGGEPLLHPGLTEIIALTRRHLPGSRVGLVTNGLLLPKMDLAFWEAARDNRLAITVTNYPIKIDHERIRELTAQYGIVTDYSWGGKLKTMNKMVLDPEGSGEKGYNFKKCHRSNGCIMLQEGRLYTCTVAPTIGHFNRYFGQNIPLTDEDGIDIYKAESGQEILEFLRHPIPFCRYCDLRTRIKGLPWRQSGREITEWFLTEGEKKKRDRRRRWRRFFFGDRK